MMCHLNRPRLILLSTDADDPSQVAPLLNQIDVGIARVTADGAYDGAPTYATIMAHGDDIEAVIPPRSTAVFSGEQGPFAQRDRHLEMITERGRLACYSLRVSSCTKSGEHELSVECSGSPH